MPKLVVALLLGAALAAAGCASTEKMEAEVIEAPPAPDSGFLNDANQMKPEPERAPFNRMWIAPDVDFKRYTKVYVAAVDTHHVLAMSLWQEVNLRQFDVKKDIADLAVEFHDDLVKAFRDDPKHHFQVVDDVKQIDAQTLMVEAALVELVPSKAWLGVLGTAAWAAPVVVGVPLGTAAAFADTGYVSMEVRMRGGDSGTVLFRAADRESGPMRVIDARSMTWYGNTHEVLGDWSTELVQFTNAAPGEQVKHSADFTLSPW